MGNGRSHTAGYRISVVTSPEQDELQHAYRTGNAIYRNVNGQQMRRPRHILTDCRQPPCNYPMQMPLIAERTMLISQITAGTDLCVSGFETELPTGYGRLKTDASGRLVAIIEESDANQDEKTITHVNGGIMAGKAGLFQTILPTIGADNAQQEYYLTDMVSLAYQGHEISYQGEASGLPALMTEPSWQQQNIICKTLRAHVWPSVGMMRPRQSPSPMIRKWATRL